ncbi:MAG: hypothetical protein R6V57_13025 [Vicinamibacterales bacterium]
MLVAAGFLAAAPLAVSAQVFTQKGFAEAKGTGYPQTTANDDTQFVGEALLRYETAAKPASWLRLNGSIDARADTHEQTEWDGISWNDRSLKRPGLAVRRLDATLTRGPLNLQVGKQFVRWGKTDILNPTDRFAPRDYLTVVDSEFLGVTAARFTAGLQADTLDFVAARFTPSRTPLVDQRWAGLAAELENVAFVDGGAEYPGRTQCGARWNHVGSGYEFSVSGFNGNNNLPLIESGAPQLPGGMPLPPAASLPGNVVPAALQVPITRAYPSLWMVGGDAALPLPIVTLKGEAAFFGSRDARADQYWLYVIQVERQSGEWVFIGGYSGEVVTTARAQVAFAPDRGLTRAFLGRASYTIDTNRSVFVEGAVRQNGDGTWLRAEYSQASGQHLRFTARATLIAGEPSDFFGRYDRNSHVTVGLRYSY